MPTLPRIKLILLHCIIYLFFVFRAQSCVELQVRWLQTSSSASTRCWLVSTATWRTGSLQLEPVNPEKFYFIFDVPQLATFIFELNNVIACIIAYIHPVYSAKTGIEPTTSWLWAVCSLVATVKTFLTVSKAKSSLKSHHSLNSNFIHIHNFEIVQEVKFNVLKLLLSL